MHTEHYYIKEEDAEKINSAKSSGHKVIAVGINTCRTLETVADEKGFVKLVKEIQEYTFIQDINLSV